VLVIGIAFAFLVGVVRRALVQVFGQRPVQLQKHVFFPFGRGQALLHEAQGATQVIARIPVTHRLGNEAQRAFRVAKPKRNAPSASQSPSSKAFAARASFRASSTVSSIRTVRYRPGTRGSTCRIISSVSP